jgi:arsenate reductase
MAEALTRAFASHVLEAYSAGTETKPKINQDAVRIIKHEYGIDMEHLQTSKLLDAIPPVDIVITMGCNVECPFVPCQFREDWGIDDPSGKDDTEFIKTAKTIERLVLGLKDRVLKGEINIK